MTDIDQSHLRGGGSAELPTSNIARTNGFLTGGGVVASIVFFISAACCVLPMIFVTAGLGGAWLALLGTLFDYRYALMSIALLAVAAGWATLFIQRARLQKACTDGLCARPIVSRTTVIILTAATLFIVGASLIMIYQDTVTRWAFQNRSLWS